MAKDDRDLHFRSTPTQKKKARKYDILRVPANGISNTVLLGHNFTWHDLHYWRKRTTPHFTENCEACEHNCPIRERGYIAVTPKDRVKVMILEVTDQCDESIKGASEMLTSLRGQVVALERMENERNGKLRIEFSGRSVDPSLLPDSPDVEEILRRVWGMAKRGPMLPEERVVMDMRKLRCSVQMPSTNGKPK